MTTVVRVMRHERELALLLVLLAQACAKTAIVTKRRTEHVAQAYDAGASFDGGDGAAPLASACPSVASASADADTHSPLDAASLGNPRSEN